MIDSGSSTPTLCLGKWFSNIVPLILSPAVRPREGGDPEHKTNAQEKGPWIPACAGNERSLWLDFNKTSTDVKTRHDRRLARDQRADACAQRLCRRRTRA